VVVAMVPSVRNVADCQIRGCTRALPDSLSVAGAW
jgi:hypothetical protein